MSSVTPSPLGAYLHRLRKAKRFSQELLAHTAGISSPYLRQIESGLNDAGKPIEPSVAMLRKLARALSDGHADEEREIYIGLMTAAGFWVEAPSLPAVATALPQTRAERRDLLVRLLETEPFDLDDRAIAMALEVLLKSLSAK